MKNSNIFVHDKNALYLNSLDEMAADFHVELNFYSLDSLKDKKVNNKRANILFIAYEVKDFYLLLENKIDFRNIIIATKNHDILNSLENTFSIKYVDLNMRQGVVRNIHKLLRKTFKPIC